MPSEMIPTLLDNRLEAERMKAAQLVVSDNINDLVKDISTKDIPMQLRAFLLENARIELVQLAKMTNSLHDLEDIFFARALDEAESTDMKSLGEMVKIGTAAVERSLDTINSIVNGKGAGNNIYINQSTTKVVNQGTNVVLADKNSAEKIRTIAAKGLRVREARMPIWSTHFLFPKWMRNSWMRKRKKIPKNHEKKWNLKKNLISKVR